MKTRIAIPVPCPHSTLTLLLLVLLGLLLALAARAATLTTTTNFAVGATIPDDAPAGLTSTRHFVSPIRSISNAVVTLDIAGGFNGDLHAWLAHDSGFVVLLNRVGRTDTSPRGYADTGFGPAPDAEPFRLSDAAAVNVHQYQTGSYTLNAAGQLTGAWQPDGRTSDPATTVDTDPPTTALSAFHGLDPNGAWTLFIADVAADEVATLQSWGLEITGFAPDPPLITDPPAAQTAECGGEAAFTVTTTGTEPLGYQWFKGADPLAGATDAALNIVPVSLLDAGGYQVVIANAAGAVTSAVAVLTVVDTTPPVVTHCGPDKVVADGAAWTFDPPAAVDACGSVSLAIVSTLTNGNCAGTFTATRVWAAADEFGNTSWCSQTVAVLGPSGEDAPCYRGQPGATYQHWAFATGASPATPEFLANPAGVPQATIAPGPLGFGWVDSLIGWGCRQGYWDLGSEGTITVEVPNLGGGAGAYKYVRAQVVAFRDSLAYHTPAVLAVAGAEFVRESEEVLESTAFGGDWVRYESIWRLPACGAGESLVLTAPPTSALIDELVVDTLCLGLPCPGDRVASADPGACGKANVSWPLPEPDGCAVASVACDPPSGSPFPVGSTSVTCEMTDLEGWMSTCQFTVTVTDDEAPVAHCPANFVVARDPLDCGTAVTWTATASDNCGVAQLVCDPPSGTVFPLGTTTVTCVATDVNGNASAPCSFTVTVVDFTGDAAPPCWRGVAGSTFQHWAFATSASPAAPELQSNSAGAPRAIINPGPLALGWVNQLAGWGCRQGYWDLGDGGTIALEIPNLGGTPGAYKYVRAQIVAFRDALAYIAPPQVELGGAVFVRGGEAVLETTAFGGEWVAYESVWRLSACGAGETLVITAPASSALIDQAVVDTLCVGFVCPGDIVAGTDPGTCEKRDVTWPLPEPDNCVVASVVCDPPAGATFPVGQTAVTCEITDLEGWVTTCEFTVTITDNEAPVVACPPNLLVPRDAVNCGTHVSWTATASDNCGGAQVVCDPPSGGEFPLGATTVTCVATDDRGNSSAPCSFTVTVVDFTGDVFAPCYRGRAGSTFQHWAFSTPASPASPELVENPAGAPRATITPGALALQWLESLPGWGCRQGYWDLGSGGTVVLEIPNLGGSAGRKYVRVQVVAFRDPLAYHTPPAVSLAGAQLVREAEQVLETTGFGGEWVAYESVWRLPVCGAMETVTLTAPESSALVDQIVVDTLCQELPALCPPPIVASADAGACGKADVSWPSVSADGCLIQEAVCDPPSGSTFPVGTTTVTCSLADAEGQTVTCDFTVTITDDEPPQIAGCPTGPMDLGCDPAPPSCADALALLTVTDNCAPPPAPVCEAGPVVANGALRSQSFRVTATDAHGNNTLCEVAYTWKEVGGISLGIRLLVGEPRRVELSWPALCPEYRLEAALTVDPGAVWSPVAEPVQVVGPLNVVQVEANLAARYFRLVKP